MLCRQICVKYSPLCQNFVVCQDYTLDAPVVPMATAKEERCSTMCQTGGEEQVLGKSTYAAIPTR